MATNSNNTPINTSLPGLPASSNTPVNSNNPYKQYDFAEMFLQQSGKTNLSRGKIQRFSLSCNNYSFQAHLDPQDFSVSENKRIVSIDTITGIVLQDFGFSPLQVEFKGTTGAAYFSEIATMENVFQNQSLNTSLATPCALTIENRTYTGVWQSFFWDRKIYEGNVYKFNVGFIVTQQGKQIITDSASSNSTVISNNKINVSANNANSQNIINYIQFGGKSPFQYVSSNPQIPNNQRKKALQWIANNWSTSLSNMRNYPGDSANLLSTEFLPTASDWQSVLNATGSSVDNTYIVSNSSS